MGEPRIKEILEEITDICKRENLWYIVKKENKPHLRDIELKITFKIK